MPRKKKSDEVLSGLIKMAKQYGMEKNEMFLSAANQYALQQRVINNIKSALDAEDSLMTTKEYVKGRENVYANPLVRELPKHADSANKTAQTIINIITTLGKKKQEEGKLAEFLNE